MTILDGKSIIISNAEALLFTCSTVLNTGWDYHHTTLPIITALIKQHAN